MLKSMGLRKLLASIKMELQVKYLISNNLKLDKHDIRKGKPMDYKYKMIVNSKAYIQCETYLRSLQNTQIDFRKKEEIINKYTKSIINEINLSSCESSIRYTYIPYLFSKYNIEITNKKESTCNSVGTNNSYTSSNINMYNNHEKKTAPTLCDGWMWYIIIMLVLSIFNGRVVGWIVITIIFIIWRANEIDKYN